ncbi:MAG: 3'-phosphoesterase [Candidatus Bathyarchaeota archaeon]|nr:MAG: 3'-phosphoesterase [Candidatus Bathyarchaeota archaeon]
MSLFEYRKKRDFSITTEPRGSMKAKELQKIFVIQKHQASHLHYDLRLEMNNVLRSWALPKNPPERVGVKRLAIEVEDHPLEYASFEGTIPEGEYGAGKVSLWDHGIYDPIKVTSNKIIINFKGEKLIGNYCLLRTRFEGKEKNWLFYKMK